MGNIQIEHDFSLEEIKSHTIKLQVWANKHLARLLRIPEFLAPGIGLFKRASAVPIPGVLGRCLASHWNFGGDDFWKGQVAGNYRVTPNKITYP